MLTGSPNLTAGALGARPPAAQPRWAGSPLAAGAGREEHPAGQSHRCASVQSATSEAPPAAAGGGGEGRTISAVFARCLALLVDQAVGLIWRASSQGRLGGGLAGDDGGEGVLQQRMSCQAGMPGSGRA